MNETQANREQFPGIEFKDDFGVEYVNSMTHRLRSRIFSAYQSESQIIECMKYTLSDMGNWKCNCVAIKYGDSWWDKSQYYNKDSAVGILFEDSLARYITKFDIERNFGHDTFILTIKVHELTPNVETNIGPNLLEYIASLF